MLECLGACFVTHLCEQKKTGQCNYHLFSGIVEIALDYQISNATQHDLGLYVLYRMHFSVVLHPSLQRCVLVDLTC